MYLGGHRDFGQRLAFHIIIWNRQWERLNISER
jgi:hypothetical protein